MKTLGVLEYIIKYQKVNIDSFNCDDDIIKNNSNRLKNIKLENGKMEYCFNYALQNKKINLTFSKNVLYLL